MSRRSQFRRRRSARSSSMSPARPVLEMIEPRQLLSGTVTASLVPVTITNAAKTADSTLSGYSTYDLKVTITGTNDWTAADLKVKLMTGQFYNPSLGSDTAQPGTWSLKPNLEFDTFVTGPSNAAPIVLGSYDPQSSTAVFSSNEVNVTWGDLVKTAAGTYTIARLTMQTGSIGTLTTRVLNADNPTTPNTLNQNFPAGAIITGNVYNDLKANGFKDGSDFGLSGRLVFIDKDFDGQIDSNETVVKTDKRGDYYFLGVSAGTYRLRQVVPSGYRPTQPSVGYFPITVDASGVGSGKNFGSTQLVLFGGRVYKDNNANGKQDSNDAGLGGWQIYIDDNNNGKLDKGEGSLKTDANGDYSFLGNPNTTYVVRVNVTNSQYRTVGKRSIWVNLAAGGIRTNVNLGEQKIA